MSLFKQIWILQHGFSRTAMFAGNTFLSGKQPTVLAAIIPWVEIAPKCTAGD